MHDIIYRAELLVVCAWLLQILRACLRLRLSSSEKSDRKFTDFFISSYRRYKMHDIIYRAELLVVYAWLLQILRACLRLRLPSSEKSDRKFTDFFYIFASKI